MAIFHGSDGPSLIARLLGALLVTLVVLLADLIFGNGSVLGPLELQTLDWRFRLRGPAAPSGEVVLVLADERTASAIGSWPPSRRVLARAVDRVAAAGADVIILNLLLAEPAGSGPTADDLDLARAIATARRVVLTYAFASAPAGPAPPPSWLAATAYRVRAGPFPTEFRPEGLILPAPEFGRAAASLGHVSPPLETDGSLRADLPAAAFANELFPSAAIEAARLRLRLARADVAVERDRGIVLGGRVVPLDGQGRQLLDHLGPEGTLATYSLADVLAGSLDPSRLGGKVVVLGASAAGVGDRFATPFTARLPGSEHVGTAVDNILTGRVLRHGATERAGEVLATTGFALLAALLAGRRSPWWSLATLLLLLGALAASLQFAFAAWHAWLAALPPAGAILLAAVSVEALRLAQERARRQRLERQRANLGRYFAPAVVDRLAASDHPTGLDRTQEAVVMFVDIVGFTRLSEAMAPAEAMALLRAFHTEVERAVFAAGGMVDKFLGDGAMACFGVPDPSPTAAADAIRAALALLAALAELPGPGLRVGIGIHAGQVLVGDIGGATQFQFTVVGDTVNVASRLESLARLHGTALLISEQAFAAAALHADLAAKFELLPGLAIRGRATPIRARRLS